MKSGDLVRFRLAHEELEGTLLESHDSSIVLVKLESGYNIGIPKDHVLGSEVIKSFESKSKKLALPVSKGKPTIGLVVTGGTIASRVDPKTGAVSPLTDMSDFVRYYPELFEAVNVKKLEMPFMTLSANMAPENWIALAKTVQTLLNDSSIEGVIVTHGTDTLHYTAAALSFFLRDLTKPVVLTYSQRSIDRASSDAQLNLLCAAKAATSNLAEVVLVGHADLNDDFCYVLRGTKVRKLHSSRRDAFHAVNIGPLAKVWPDKIEFLTKVNARKEGVCELDAVFNDKVALIKYYPGQDPEILEYYKNYKGLIIEAYGLGNMPSADSKYTWLPGLKKLIDNGCVVCTTAQTIQGSLNPNVYSTGRGLTKIGVIALRDMLSETAFVKLGWALGHKNWKARDQIGEKMLENISGELNTTITQ